MSLTVLRTKEDTLIHCDNSLSAMHAPEWVFMLTFTIWTWPQRVEVRLTERVGLLHVPKLFSRDNVR